MQHVAYNKLATNLQQINNFTKKIESLQHILNILICQRAVQHVVQRN